MPGQYPNLVPLGKITVATVGITVSLAVNCGPQAGQTGGTQSSPARPGYTLRQIRLTADKGNLGQVFLLPRGSTAAANPANILVAITAGQSVVIPDGAMLSGGMQPENYVLDADTMGQVVYGLACRG